MFHGFATGKDDDLEDRSIDLKGLLPRRRFLDEAVDPAGNLAGSASIPDDGGRRKSS
jgi:hypothetical protein